ncbi:SWR1 complex bromodomain subunit bdf1 [Choanephora cucurbitarum]|uniref:SWR1 complex bromodomain subunit bdf1 n=1 Tax=Choanephora cucurbitarum TaxID=101091 RepID=A0A1C7MUS7_9FUNG|nr:SWR1 complex bromodomain subunit bdf1 [Choanephora cucurbitarum]
MSKTNHSIQKSHTILPSPPIYQHTMMTPDQQKYCSAIMRNLKKHRDAAPFLNPVDYVKLNVLDYPSVIKRPMHLLLVDKKLNNTEYANVEDFISDVRLIFNNCFKYNGPEAMISVLCQNVESAFEKSLRQMPPSTPIISPKKELSPPLSHSSQQEYFTKPISEDLNRPKREIHCPSKDYPETYTTQKKRQMSAEMKFCLQTLRELKKAKYRSIAYPFLQPVDYVALNIPDYPTIVQQPMDLSTIERKLMNHEYANADMFESDITLMFNNCYLYNPPTLPIYKMAKDYEKVFQQKWNEKPREDKKRQKRKAKEPIEESEEDDRIAELERHIASISEQIASIKSAKKPRRNPPAKRKKPTKARSTEEEEFTFEQKKDLSEMINELTGDKLDTVVSIIQSSMPNLQGNGQQEIELDIDALDIQTLRRLYEFVNPKVKTTKKKVKRAKPNLKDQLEDYGKHLEIHDIQT